MTTRDMFAAFAIVIGAGIAVAAFGSDGGAEMQGERPRLFAAGATGGDFNFDRGRWCEYKKVEVYDPFHKESFLVDRKVCLNDIVQ